MHTHPWHSPDAPPAAHARTPRHALARLQLGGGNFYGPSGISFFTQTKTVTSAWKPFEADSGSAAAQMTMPTPGKA